MKTLQSVAQVALLNFALLTGPSGAKEPQEPVQPQGGGLKVNAPINQSDIQLQLKALATTAELISVLVDTRKDLPADMRGNWAKKSEELRTIQKTVSEALQRPQDPKNLEIFDKLLSSNSDSLKLFYRELIRAPSNPQQPQSAPLAIGVYDEANFQGMKSAAGIFERKLRDTLKTNNSQPGGLEGAVLEGLAKINQAKNPGELTKSLEPLIESMLSNPAQSSSNLKIASEFSKLLKGVKSELNPNTKITVNPLTSSEKAWNDLEKQLREAPEVKRRLHPGAKAGQITQKLEALSQEGESNLATIRYGALKLAEQFKSSKPEEAQILKAIGDAKNFDEIKRIDKGLSTLSTVLVESWR